MNAMGNIRDRNEKQLGIGRAMYEQIPKRKYGNFWGLGLGDW